MLSWDWTPLETQTDNLSRGHKHQDDRATRRQDKFNKTIYKCNINVIQNCKFDYLCSCKTSKVWSCASHTYKFTNYKSTSSSFINWIGSSVLRLLNLSTWLHFIPSLLSMLFTSFCLAAHSTQWSCFYCFSF